jgi:hypothetical protein
MGIVKSMALASVATLSMFTSVLVADIINVDEAFWKDSRSTNAGGGITATQLWSGNKNDGFMLSWQISQSNGLYHYIYNITDISGKSLDKKLSSFILQVGDAFTSKDYLDSKGVPVKDIVVSKFTSEDFGSIPGNMYGINTSNNSSTLKIDFFSTRAPVWGSFYADGGINAGKDVVAFNTGFTSTSSTPSTGTKEFSNYIARPGAENAAAVPEPTTMVIMGSSLAAIYLARRKNTSDKMCAADFCSERT